MKKKISFVIPCYCSEKTIDSVVCEIKETMNGLTRYDYEIVLINDSSPDNTYDVLKKICNTENNITVIDMAKNFGQHAALMAGFGIACGDIVVCLDDDGQTPADEVGKLLDEIENGYDVVYARYEEKKLPDPEGTDREGLPGYGVPYPCTALQQWSAPGSL